MNDLSNSISIEAETPEIFVGELLELLHEANRELLRCYGYKGVPQTVQLHVKIGKFLAENFPSYPCSCLFCAKK